MRFITVLLFLFSFSFTEVSKKPTLEWWVSDTLYRTFSPYSEAQKNNIEYIQKYFIVISKDGENCELQAIDLQSDLTKLSLKSKGKWKNGTCNLAQITFSENSGWNQENTNNIIVAEGDYLIYSNDTLNSTKTNEQSRQILEDLQQRSTIESAQTLKFTIRLLYFGALLGLIIWGLSGLK